MQTFERVIVLVCAVLFAAAQTAQAGFKVWTSHGPGTVGINALAVDPMTPTTLYAVTTNGIGSFGVFKSTDGAATWYEAKEGLGDAALVSLAIDPHTPSTLYASAVGGEVLKSTDGGATWREATQLPATVVTLAFDPVTPGTLYAYGRDGLGVLKSTDGGNTWNPANAGLNDGNVNALVIDPLTPLTLYASTGDGVFKSTDGAATWREATTFVNVVTLAIDPVTPSTLYAYSGPHDCGLFSCAGNELYKTTDAGETWSSLPALPFDFPYDLAIDPLIPTTLYVLSPGGVFKSTDGAATWHEANAGLADTGGVYTVAIDPHTPSTLYAGGLGVYKSTDAGGSWSAANTGLPGAAVVEALAIDPTTPTTLYAGGGDGEYGGGGGVSRSTDAGGTWSAANAGLPNLLVLFALAIDPTTPTTLYAAGVAQGVGADVFKSTDAGGHWDVASLGLPDDASVSAFAIDPTTSGTLYAATVGGVPGVYAAVYKSTDAGGTWSAASPPRSSGYAVAIDPQAPRTIYAGTEQGLFKSTDAGSTWSLANTGLPTGNDAIVLAVAIDPATPSTLYAGVSVLRAGGGVYKSIDGGQSWRVVLRARSDVHALAIDPLIPSTLYAGTGRSRYTGEPAGVFKSTDGGITWSPLNRGLSVLNVRALAINPRSPTTLYAGTYGGGVFSIQQRGDCSGVGVPKSECRTSQNSLLLFSQNDGGGGDKLIWKWGNGQATTQAAFADPTATTDYALCVYAGESLAGRGEVSASDSRWSQLGSKGYKYKDAAAAEGDVQTMLLRGGSDGRARILVKGKGANLLDPELPFATPVTVQLVNRDSNVCWESVFESADVFKNEAGQFKARR